MEILQNHPLVVWFILVPVALAILAVMALFMVVSFLPSPSIEALVARYMPKRRS